MMRRLVALVLASLAASACGGSGKGANWLTDPGVAGHSRFFPLVNTPHDPTAVGTTVSCEGCHPGNTFAEFDCATCHTAAATDPLHVGVSGYTHTSAACLQCHPTGSIAAPPNHDAADFPRGAGTSHAAIGCIQCHTDLTNPTSTANFACAGCHSGLSGGFAAGHANVVGVDASTTSAQCLVCHGDGQINPVASHTLFPIAKGSATHDTVCLQCHTTLRTGKPYAYAADFTAYECTGCHGQAATDPLHSGVSGYVWASPSCYGCHPSGAGGMPANHDTAFFPRGTGSAHDGITCAQCHTDLANPANPANFACASCHAGISTFAGKHNPIGGVAILTVRTSCTSSTTLSLTDSTNCLRCHADSQVFRVSSHSTGESALGNSNHRGAGCLTCHVAMRTDKTFATDFAKSGASQGSPGCATCHNGGCGGGG